MKSSLCKVQGYYSELKIKFRYLKKKKRLQGKKGYENNKQKPLSLECLLCGPTRKPTELLYLNLLDLPFLSDHKYEKKSSYSWLESDEFAEKDRTCLCVH